MKLVMFTFRRKGGNLKAWQRQFAVWLAERFVNKLQHKLLKMTGVMLMGRHQRLINKGAIGHDWAYEELIIARRRKAAAN